MYIHVHVCLQGVLCFFTLFVCLTLLASFFLPSHLSFKNMYVYSMCMHVHAVHELGNIIIVWRCVARNRLVDKILLSPSLCSAARRIP